jgi:hypothetical protein
MSRIIASSSSVGNIFRCGTRSSICSSFPLASPLATGFAAACTGSNGDSPSYLTTARVAAQHPAQLAPLLCLIALERGAGSFEISSN